MIQGSDFIWQHLPKCAGHTVEMALRAGLLGRRDINFDPRFPEYIGWHDGLRSRAWRDPAFNPDGKTVISGFRRLPHWILSRVHYEASRPPYRCATRDMVRRGAYFEQTGEVFTADSLLQHYVFPEHTQQWIRVEHMLEDFRSVFSSVIGARMPAAEWQLRQVRNQTQIRYLEAVEFHFTQEDLVALYDANPLWASLERELYGSTLVETHTSQATEAAGRADPRLRSQAVA